MHFPYCQWLKGQGRLKDWLETQISPEVVSRRILSPRWSCCLYQEYLGWEPKNKETWSPWTICQMNNYPWHTHCLCGLQSKWKRMMFTFKGRVKRVEGFCHVFIWVQLHSFSGIPNIRFTRICPSSEVTCPSHWNLTNCQTSVIRISVVIILPTCSRPDCPGQWEKGRKLIRPMRTEDRHGAIHSCRAAHYQ